MLHTPLALIQGCKDLSVNDSSAAKMAASHRDSKHKKLIMTLIVPLYLDRCVPLSETYTYIWQLFSLILTGEEKKKRIVSPSGKGSWRLTQEPKKGDFGFMGFPILLFIYLIFGK